MKKSQKNLLSAFNYITNFCADAIDALHALLAFLAHADPKKIQNSGANLKKIRRLLENPIAPQDLEEFLHIITQQQTRNALHFYAAPKEINQLMTGLLEISCDETLYNPCFGLGSCFLALPPALRGKIQIFGEEKDARLVEIARLILQILGSSAENLHANDLLKSPKFSESFDKILCDPPFFARIGMKFLKNDSRFDGVAQGSYPELAFLAHALSHMRTRGVFIVRNLALYKENAQKILKNLLGNGLLRAIINLPRNIFPYKKSAFCIIVVSKNNEKILCVDASTTDFAQKIGKYNRLKNPAQILNAVQNWENSGEILDFCREISSHTFFAQKNLGDIFARTGDCGYFSLADLGFRAIKTPKITPDPEFHVKHTAYFDATLADFSPLGFTQNFSHKKSTTDPRAQNFALKKYDILVSLRGVNKITIIGELKNLTLCNSTFVILRHENERTAINLYCFLFGDAGRLALKNAQKIGQSLDFLALLIPKDFEKYGKNWDEIQDLAKKFQKISKKIAALQNDKIS